MLIAKTIATIGQISIVIFGTRLARGLSSGIKT
jgi:hypothetical protein